MKISNSEIITIWNDIADSESRGFYKRLIANNDKTVYVYAIVQLPERHYGIAISFDKCTKVDLSSFSNLRDLIITTSDDNTFKGKTTLYITLLQHYNSDIFSVLCSDLINRIGNTAKNGEVMNIAINQLQKWQTLFDRIRIGGLSPAEQQGLYGELIFLHKCLLKSENHNHIVNSWVGVDKEIRDFQYNNWAVEVKTTAGNNHQRILVSSERQLDDTLLEHLFLYHLSVEISKGNGETLNQKIQSVKELLSRNAAILHTFNMKLLEAGYLDVQSDIYNERSYLKRDEHYYSVKAEFPRIKESEVRNGVGDVKYSIILSHCDRYLITESQLFKTILQ